MSTRQLGLSIGLALAFTAAKVLGKSCRMPRTNYTWLYVKALLQEKLPAVVPGKPLVEPYRMRVFGGSYHFDQDRLGLDLLYKAASAQNDTMETVLEHFKVLLERLAKNPERNPAALAMRTKSEGRERFWKTLDAVGEGR